MIRLILRELCFEVFLFVCFMSQKIPDTKFLREMRKYENKEKSLHNIRKLSLMFKKTLMVLDI